MKRRKKRTNPHTEAFKTEFEREAWNFWNTPAEPAPDPSDPGPSRILVQDRYREWRWKLGAKSRPRAFT